MNGKNISAQKIKSLLKGDGSVKVYNSLDSTNATAKELVARGDAKTGDLIIALSQTKGRGRMGRSFYSPENCGIYFSLVLRPNISAEDISLITPVAAVAVATAIEGFYEKTPKIKWVNDIFINEKKVCGILSEAVFGANGVAECVILGIGINLTAPKEGYPEEIKSIAGSVFLADEDFDANHLIADTANRFLELYGNLKSENTVNEYRKRMLLIGSEVKYTLNSKEQIGRVVDIDNRYRLIVEKQNGEMEYLQSGEVTIKSKTIFNK